MALIACSLRSSFEDEVGVSFVFLFEFVHPAIKGVLGNYHHACLLSVLILLERAQVIEKAVDDLLCVVLGYLCLLSQRHLRLNLGKWLDRHDQLELWKLVYVWIEGPARVEDVTGARVCYGSDESHA